MGELTHTTFCWETCLHPRSYTVEDLQEGALLQTLRNVEDEDSEVSCDIPAALALTAHLLKPVAASVPMSSGYDLPNAGLE